MFFKRTPLEDAVAQIHKSLEIAYKYKRDKSFKPTEHDLQLFKDIEAGFEHCSMVSGYITRCMEQRAVGEKEGAKKYSDKDALNWN